jgi:predicted transcriptional regulator
MRELERLSGVGFVTIARLEAGQLDPRLSTLQKLCKALKVSLAELVEGHRRG